MIVILDINALLVAIPRKSIYRPILDALIAGKFQVVISNDILSEYTEVIERKANAIVANNIAEMLLSLDNLIKVDVYFEWRIIDKDPDDNKYIDAAIAGTADFIVSNDQHFKVIKSIDFPKLNLITIEEFLKLVTAK